MSKQAAFVILRRKIYPVLDSLHRVWPDAALKIGTEEKEVSLFSEILDGTLRSSFHIGNWLLHGTQLDQLAPPNLDTIGRDYVEWRELATYVEELSRGYSWSIIPWGFQWHGLMIAVIASDQDIFRRMMNYLRPADLVVSSYTLDDLKTMSFRGAAFSVPAEVGVGAVWRYGRGLHRSALALIEERGHSVPALVGTAEVVCEERGDSCGPVLRRWIRCKDEEATKTYAANWITVAPDTDEKVLWLAIQDFAGVAQEVNVDPLAYGLKAMQSASWIYIPRRGDIPWQLYLNQDAKATRSVLQSEDLQSGGYFGLKCFC
jgi:hypothetical protein